MITLINPPGVKTFSGLQMHVPNAPLGLAYIASSLKEAGLEYRIVDSVGEGMETVSPYPERKDFLLQGLPFEETVRRIPAETDIIGIACMFSTLWPLTNRLVRIIRKAFPKALLVLGGEHGTAVYENVLETSPFDVVVLGEGEQTFVDLVGAYRKDGALQGVSGIAYKDGGEIKNTGLSERRRDIDKIPLPDWDSFPIENYISGGQVNAVNLGRTIPLLATRGCPFECTFCSNPGMWTRRWIPRDPKLVVDEMALYNQKYKVTNFDLQDLTAIVKRSWVIEFCQEILSRGLKIHWQMPVGTRSEVFDEEVADLLYRSGCRALAFAPESGSVEILHAVKKQVNLDKMLASVKIAVDRGLSLSCFFVIGFPGDTSESLAKSMRLVRKAAVLGVSDISVAKFVPYPGSELFRSLQKSGKLEMDDTFFISPMDFYTSTGVSYADKISPKELHRWMIRMFVNFYVISFLLRPFKVARILLKALFTGKEETRYAKWFVDRLFVRPRWEALRRKVSGG